MAIDEGEGGADVVARYRTPPEGVRALGIAVTGAGRILGQRRLQTERVLNCYAGVLVLRGAGFLELQGRGRHEVRPGSFFWLPPGISHRYGPTPDGWDEYWVLFDGPAAAAYRDLGHLGAEHPVARPADPDEARGLCVRVLDLLTAPESLDSHMAATSSLHALITAVGSGRPRSADPAPARRDIGRRALQLLDATDGPVRIGAIAQELCVSRDTLITAVRRITGSPPTVYLTRRRIDRAKALLTDTDRPVALIGRDVGYPDPAYFSRLFTRHVGVAPSVFRKQQSR
ncbi:helix-turn-helix domain-containing protein [Streptomyces sp. MSC1_001]|uniref:helix-turn-helix domain-containing protein n=1 Tax=Streptomyces sp. MSC1_001 TaxID=2909263 RepID=UPI00202EAEEC|nr:AraC family transcriptional regulator [Streptomyces sp. MSC1_001]